MSQRKVVISGVFLLLGFALILCTAPVHAHPDTAHPPVGALAGKILDAAGQPAGGATVWLFGGSYEKLKDLEKTTTDADGSFIFNDAQAKYSNLPGGSLPHIFVQSAQGQIGADRNLWSYPQNKPLQAVRIQLMETRAYRGRLVDLSGQPIAKATVRPRVLELEIPGQRYSESAALCPAMIEKCHGETDADGDFTLNFMPVEGKVSAELATPGSGAILGSWSLQQPVTIQFIKPGRIQGSLAAPSAVDSLAGVKIYLSSVFVKDAKSDMAYHFSPLTKEISTGKDGSFQFADVPLGKYALHPQFAESDVPFSAKPSAEFEVKTGEVAVVSVPLSPAIEVRGQVVDEQTGKGIQGARVFSRKIEEKAGYSPGRFATTDSNGDYRLFTEAGKIAVRVVEPPADYVESVAEEKSSPLEVNEPVKHPVIKLQKAVTVEVTVVDESGKPASGAEIQMLLPKSPCEQIVENADENGRFVVKKLVPQKTFSLRARSTNAISETRDILPSKVSEPLRLVLATKQVFAMRGVCLDEAGKPIREAKVSACSAWMLGPTGIGTSEGNVLTDAEGRFEIGLLWPGSQYTLQINAEGYDKYESPRVGASASQTHDFGKIVLRDQSGFIEGTVVDSAGKPLADVHVFHHRDAVKPLSAITDAAGKFHLSSLRSGSDYLFAEKDGFRLKAAYLPTKSAGVKIVLTRHEESMAPWKAEREPTSFAEEQATARKLLEKLYAVPKNGSRAWCYRFMARLDQQGALQWSQPIGGRFDNEVRQMVAEQIAETDADEAIALLNSITDYSMFSTLCTLAERYAATDADKSNRFLEEAILLARKLDQPSRTHALAKAGTLAVHLGKAEGGRKIIEEAAEAVTKMGVSDRNTYVRYRVAAAIAPYDLARAMSLLEPLTEKNSKDDGMAAIAAGLATKDLDKALEILSKVDKRSTLPDNTRLKIACQLAPAKLQDALRAVESMDTHGAKKIRAEAYARLAELIAPTDQKQAWALIEKSMKLYEENAQEMQSWTFYGDRSTFAAHLVVKAAQCGYPEIGELIDRTLAIRPVDNEGYRIRETQKNIVAMAKYLALVDPTTAKQLLESVSPRCELLKEFGFPGIEPYDWSEAWALADLPQLTGMLEHRLEAAAKDPEIDLDNWGLDQTLELLTTTPALRIPVLDRFTRSFLSTEDEY